MRLQREWPFFVSERRTGIIGAAELREMIAPLLKGLICLEARGSEASLPALTFSRPNL